MVNYSENAIKEAAYYIWQNAGCPSGLEAQHWMMAVEQVSCNCSSNSCKSSAKKTTTKTASSASSSKTSSSKSAACKSTAASKKSAK